MVHSDYFLGDALASALGDTLAAGLGDALASTFGEAFGDALASGIAKKKYISWQRKNTIKNEISTYEHVKNENLKFKGKLKKENFKAEKLTL